MKISIAIVLVYLFLSILTLKLTFLLSSRKNIYIEANVYRKYCTRLKQSEIYNNNIQDDTKYILELKKLCLYPS